MWEIEGDFYNLCENLFSPFELFYLADTSYIGFYCLAPTPPLYTRLLFITPIAKSEATKIFVWDMCCSQIVIKIKLSQGRRILIKFDDLSIVTGWTNSDQIVTVRTNSNENCHWADKFWSNCHMADKFWSNCHTADKF